MQIFSYHDIFAINSSVKFPLMALRNVWHQSEGWLELLIFPPLSYDKNRISARCKVLSVEFEITDCIFSWPVSRDRFPQSFWQDKTDPEGRRRGGGREGVGGLNLSKTCFCYFTRDQCSTHCWAARIINSFPHFFPRSSKFVQFIFSSNLNFLIFPRPNLTVLKSLERFICSKINMNISLESAATLWGMKFSPRRRKVKLGHFYCQERGGGRGDLILWISIG